jgi:hypothetical protein
VFKIAREQKVPAMRSMLVIVAAVLAESGVATYADPVEQQSVKILIGRADDSNIYIRSMQQQSTGIWHVSVLQAFDTISDTGEVLRAGGERIDFRMAIDCKYRTFARMSGNYVVPEWMQLDNDKTAELLGKYLCKADPKK